MAKPTNKTHLWASGIEDLYERMYTVGGRGWPDAWTRGQKLNSFLGYYGQSVLARLARYSDLYTRLSDSKHRYDRDATDAMIRISEPILRGYYEIIIAMGTNMPIGKLRKSVPSKSRLQRIYSQSCVFNPFLYAPYEYSKQVKDKTNPIDYERAYYLMAISRHSNLTTPEHVLLMKEVVREYIRNSWGYRRASRQNQGSRNRYEYILHPDLRNSHIEELMRVGRDIYKDVLLLKITPTGSTPTKIDGRMIRLITLALSMPVYRYITDLRSGKLTYGEVK